MTPEQHRTAAIDIIRRRANDTGSLAVADYCYHFGLDASVEDREAIADLIGKAQVTITLDAEPVDQPHPAVYRIQAASIAGSYLAQTVRLKLDELSPERHGRELVGVAQPIAVWLEHGLDSNRRPIDDAEDEVLAAAIAWWTVRNDQSFDLEPSADPEGDLDRAVTLLMAAREG